MSIEEQFNKVAQEYDANRRKFIPCFDDFYDATTDFIAASIPSPRRVLDLGAGTGLLTYYWYRHFPDADYLLVDIADEMLNVARERFSGFENIHYLVQNYAEALPPDSFDCIISALSIHHLENDDKNTLFHRIFEKLPTGGVFVNYDQFCAGSEPMNSWYDTYWINNLEHSRLTPDDIAKWRERKKLDREISVEDEFMMLRRCGFSDIQCVYSCQKFSVIVAIKMQIQ